MSNVYKILFYVCIIVFAIATANFFLSQEKEKKVEPLPVVQSEVVEAIEPHTYSLLVNVYDVKPWRAKSLSMTINDAAIVEDVPVNILVAVIREESNFKMVVGDNGRSVGYGQIQTRFWSNGKYDPNNHVDNIYLTAHILRTNYDKLGSWDKSIEVYNIGITNYRKNKARISGKKYLTRVQKYLTLNRKYEKEYQHLSMASR